MGNAFFKVTDQNLDKQVPAGRFGKKDISKLL